MPKMVKAMSPRSDLVSLPSFTIHQASKGPNINATSPPANLFDTAWRSLGFFDDGEAGEGASEAGDDGFSAQVTGCRNSTSRLNSQPWSAQKNWWARSGPSGIG
jgi:hypothetical protein